MATDWHLPLLTHMSFLKTRGCDFRIDRCRISVRLEYVCCQKVRGHSKSFSLFDIGSCLISEQCRCLHAVPEISVFEQKEGRTRVLAPPGFKVRVRTRQYESVRNRSSHYKSVRVGTSQYESVRVSTSPYASVLVALLATCQGRGGERNPPISILC